MPTVLDKTLKRQLIVNKEPYILTLSPTGFMILPKGKRKGVEIPWHSVVNGDAALATALNASLQFTAESEKPKKVATRRMSRRQPKGA